MTAILALNVFIAACTPTFKVLQKLYLLNNSCASEIAEALGGGEKERAKGVVLLLEFFCLCKPLRLFWQRTPAGI